ALTCQCRDRRSAQATAPLLTHCRAGPSVSRLRAAVRLARKPSWRITSPSVACVGSVACRFGRPYARGGGPALFQPPEYFRGPTEHVGQSMRGRHRTVGSAVG